MLQGWLVLSISFAYLGLLFAIAYYGDKRADMKRSIISNPYIYSLSLAVYCTAWTFYGSVGRAVSTGVGFLPVYLGPTLIISVWWVVMRRIIRISKRYRITSIADFIASRYGKSSLLGGVVTFIAVMGIIPYIALQLKAISTSYLVIQNALPTTSAEFTLSVIANDTAFYVALVLALFAILFGTRHLDATERHEGMVAAIAFESLVKLVAFLLVGLFVTYGMYDGFGDIFTRASQNPEFRKLFTMPGESSAYIDWAWLTLLSMLAIMFLPRQFQVTVVENVDERHLDKAIWLFPLYLFAINIFVLPIAFGGLLHFSGTGVDADTYVLSLPLSENQTFFALLAFIGGLSAATSMVIVASIALSTMLCNDLIMPILFRLPFLKLDKERELTGLLLGIRRASILLIILLSYVYFHFIGNYYSLVSIGLISFAAVAQFAPAILGGIFWKQGNRLGALTGLIAGFLVWLYTLPFPTLVQAGVFPKHILTEGLFGIALLRPFQLFGMTALTNPITHALFWSLLFNVGSYVIISVFTKPSGIEHNQASLFVDVFKYTDGTGASVLWRGTTSVRELHDLLRRFLGKRSADKALEQYAANHGINWSKVREVDAEFVNYVEKLLAGAIGSASARAMVATVVQEEPLTMEEVMNILDETQQILITSRALERKSKELEKATRELKAANKRLKELDRLKDEFISTITHELRTPLTSVRAFTEILYDNPDMELSQRQHFLGIIIKESERLTRLINQVLDLQKIESATMEWNITKLDIRDVINDSVTAMDQLIKEKRIEMNLFLPGTPSYISGDRDRLMQVMLNLLSNAIKFCDSDKGIITIRLHVRSNHIQVDVHDNGVGISPEDQKVIFEKFRQVHSNVKDKPGGSGLGLTITKKIVEYHGGKIWVKSKMNEGTTFSFTLPSWETVQMEMIKETAE